jgi:hypothetical protein
MRGRATYIPSVHPILPLRCSIFAWPIRNTRDEQHHPLTRTAVQSFVPGTMADPIANYPPGYLDEYNGYLLTNLSIAFLILELVFWALRFWSRRLGKVGWRMDDVFIVLALICTIGTCIGSLGAWPARCPRCPTRPC